MMKAFFFKLLVLFHVITLSLYSEGNYSIVFVHIGSKIPSYASLAIAEAELFKDRKSTRLNSSHSSISYAVFCLKKKNIQLLRLNRFNTLTLKVLSLIPILLATLYYMAT